MDRNVTYELSYNWKGVDNMELTQAIEILTNFVKTDRIMRNYDTTTDHEQFCEERCLAIEVVLKELNKKGCDCC